MGSPHYQLTAQLSGTGGGTVTSSPTGINCGSTCSAMFSGGTSITLAAAPATGSTFAGWSGGACNGASACTVTLQSDTTVTATFNPVSVPPVQLTVQNAGSGSGSVTSSPTGISCGSACSASFPSGSAVTLTATPAAGSTFSGWSGACTGSSSTCTLTLAANTSVTANFNANSTTSYQLTVQTAGTGSGSVTSNPAAITCPTTCSAGFASGTAVTLTAAAATASSFTGWSGACTGVGACTITISADTTVTATFNASSGTGGLSSINHVLILMQENRSLDNYLGALRQYWAQNGYPDQSFDGLPQFNPASGAAPLQGAAPSVPGCDPTQPPPADCAFDPNNPITSFHLQTMCTENTSPSWNESHVDWNYNDQVGLYPATLNGFGWVTGHDSRNEGYYDVDGIRVMGYYDGGDLNYLYFMASNFATSDRWFNPVMSRTNINREYLLAATSQGYAYPNGTNSNDQALLTAKTIFEDMQDAGVTWKIYVNPQGSTCTQPYTASCLMTLSYLQNFTYAQTVISQYPQNIVPISQYFTDVQNGTLPQVAEIEPASDAGEDEHGSDSDKSPENIQTGETYASSLINTLMQSPSWKDSAVFLTYDEFGGLYDHVPPQPAVSPDGIKPVDLNPGDACTKVTGPTCDFTYTGYRVPLVVISPYAKKNYVSHTVADYTAMLKFIETRFNLPSLTKRDAAQMDMTEFFDFNNPSWTTPPPPPVQNTGGACYLDHLP